MPERKTFDAIVVGAGFGGVHMLYELQKLGMSACGIEAGSNVGLALFRQKVLEEMGSHFAAMQFGAERKVA